ncbi:MAG: hypothetical protein Q8R63_00745 [Ramlibacter sp.]|nr:hypothetical protein [Ramlibacter sp.]
MTTSQAAPRPIIGHTTHDAARSRLDAASGTIRDAQGRARSARQEPSLGGRLQSKLDTLREMVAAKKSYIHSLQDSNPTVGVPRPPIEAGRYHGADSQQLSEAAPQALSQGSTDDELLKSIVSMANLSREHPDLERPEALASLAARFSAHRFGPLTVQEKVSLLNALHQLPALQGDATSRDLEQSLLAEARLMVPPISSAEQEGVDSRREFGELARFAQQLTCLRPGAAVQLRTFVHDSANQGLKDLLAEVQVEMRGGSAATASRAMDEARDLCTSLVRFEAQPDGRGSGNVQELVPARMAKALRANTPAIDGLRRACAGKKVVVEGGRSRETSQPTELSRAYARGPRGATQHEKHETANVRLALQVFEAAVKDNHDRQLAGRVARSAAARPMARPIGPASR